MAKTVRFSVSIDGELLQRFDELIKEKRYEDRSTAIKNLIRDFLIENEWERAEGR